MTKSALLTLTVFLLGLFSAGAVLGAGEMRVQGAQSAGQPGMAQVTADMLHSADSLVGVQVRDRTGQEVGEIQGIMIDMNRGVSYARVSTEEAMRIDETYLVPLSALSSTHEGNYVTLNVDRDRLVTGPKMEPGMTGEEFGRRIHEHYGVSSPWDDLPGDEPIRREDIPGENLTYPGPRDVSPPAPQGETR